MAGMDWFRWHHGSVTDPKFKLIAKRASARVADVVAVWACILEFGSQNGSRLSRFDMDACDELLELPKGASLKISIALTQKGFLAGDRIVNPRRYFPAPGMRPSGGIWSSIRSQIFKRDNYICQYCGAHGVRLECDHIIPVADGGQHIETNLITACLACNRSKGARSVNEWEASRGW